MSIDQQTMLTSPFLPLSGLRAAAANPGATAVACPAGVVYAMGQMARQCDGLVARQRRCYSADRAELIEAMRASYDALRAIAADLGVA